ncbi:MAG: hemagglutinin repeat-containing protein [Pedobacter sp.]
MKGNRTICLTLSLLLIFSQTLSAAEIQVDTSASKANQAYLGQAPNGVPVVNITTPNAQGISHNKFNTYNVQKQGLILNNANVIANTQLAGYIPYNPNLSVKQARLILNEVTGTSKTLLQGYTEVAGKPADVIIANPNGISVNGGGFINTPSATLTTGSPIMNGTMLQGFDVSSGDIVIEGDGFNANNIARVNLYAKALQLNAKLYADKLNVVAGENTIALDGAISDKNRAGTGMAIDSSLLGGIYANTITLHSSDKGIGVHLPPEVFAQNSFALTADGDIVLSKAVAGSHLEVYSHNAGIQLTNDITANDVTISAQKNISMAEIAVTSATHSLQVFAEFLDNKGELTALEETGSNTVSVAQKLNNQGLIGGADLAIFATDIDNTGALYSINNLEISARNLDNTGVIRSNNAISLLVEDTLTNQKEGVIDSDCDLTIAANRANDKINHVTNLGLMQSGGNIGITAKTLSNIADAPTMKQLTSTKTQKISRGGKYDYDVVTTTTQQQVVAVPSDPALILAAGDISIDLDTLDNHYSLIAADEDIDLYANIANNVGNILVDTITTVTKKYRKERYCSSRVFGACVNHKHRAGYRGTFTSTDTQKTPLPGHGIQARQSITGNVITLNNTGAEGLYQTDTHHALLQSPDIQHTSNGDIIIDNLTLPKGNFGLFLLNKASNHPYLIEANPLFTNYKTFISSDYMLEKLNHRPETIIKRLGDGMYETDFVRNSVIAQSGKRYLEGYASDLEQYKGLMDNALALQEKLQLAFGITLTKEQVAQLDKNIVWLEDRIVDGEKVLVPQLYLAANNIATYGPQIAANTIDLNVEETLLNEGTIVARSRMDITADKLTNKNGALVSENAMNLLVGGELQNLSGTIASGGDMRLVANTITGSAITEEKIYNYARGSQTSTLKGNETRFIAGGNLTMEAPDNITLSNTTAHSGETLLLASHEGDVRINALELNEEYDFDLANGYNRGGSLTNAVSSLEGKNIAIAANQIDITASSLNAGETIALQATQGISILAANDLTHQDTQIELDDGFLGGEIERDMSHQESVVQSNLQARNILIQAQNEGITLESANLIAGENIVLDAKKDINVLAKQYREGSLHTTTKSSWGGLSQSAQLKRTDALNVKEAELRTEALNIILKSGNDIRIIGSNVDAASDLHLQAANDILIAAAQELRQDEQWSKKSSFNLGNLITSLATMGMLNTGPIYEMEYHKDQTTDIKAKSSTLNSGNDIVLEAPNATVIGSDLTAQNTLRATTSTGDINILSAEEKRDSHSSTRKMEVSLANIMDATKAFTPKQGETQLKIALANATYDDTDHSSQALTHKSSNLTGEDGDILLNAHQNILIEGSTVAAGKSVELLAQTGDVTIKEAIDTFSENSKDKHASAEISLTVQNEYVEIGSAVKAAAEAAKQLLQVKDDYLQFKDQLSSLQSALSDTKKAYRNKEAGVDYEDIEDLEELIDHVSDNEKYYVAAVAAATADLASKTVAIATQVATAASSSYTWGFSAGLALDLHGSKTNSRADTTRSLNAIITGKDITITTNPLESTQVAIRGATLAAKDNLEIATHDLNVSASTDTYQAKQDSKDLSGSLSMTMYGGGSGMAGSMGYGGNHASQESTSHTNSELLAKNINLTVANDALFEGATVRADDTLNLEVGNDLDIISLRDSSSSNSKGFNVGASFSLGNDQEYTADRGDYANEQEHKAAQGKLNQAIGARVGDGLGSVGASFGASAGTTQVKQTVLTSLTGENVHVEVGGNTHLKGALLAAGEVNEEGIFIDNENLAFKTETLTFGNSTNSSYSSSNSFNAGTNIGFGSTKDPQPDTNETTPKVNSSTLSLGNDMGYSSSKVLATLGKGDVQIGNLEYSDDLDRLNRDTEALNKNLYSGSVSTSVDATLDHRLLSEEGRGEIAQEYEIALEEGEIMLDGTVDVAITAAGGAKDMVLSVASLPLLVVERLSVFHDFETLLDYMAKHIEVPAKGFERRWSFSRKADLAASSLMLGQEVPLIGNFVPSVKGNMDGEVTRWITGGINANSEKISIKRDAYTEGALNINGSDYNYASNVGDSATRVAMSLFLGYKSRGLEMADYVVSGTPENSTVLMYSHSGGVSRASLASNYTAIYGIGVKKLAADQGPGFGLYNNIDSLQATYSVGLQEPTSNLGALLSFGYWSTGNNDHMYFGEGRKGFGGTILGDAHRQLGNPKNLDAYSLEIGNEYRRITYDFLEK